MFAPNDDFVEHESESGLVKVTWPNNGAAKAMLGRLMDEWKEGSVIYSILRHWVFSGQDLSVADLSMTTVDSRGEIDDGVIQTDLRNARFNGVKLFGANLFGVNLCRASLNETNFILANLYQAEMQEADLRKASLISTELRFANLGEANLRGADCSRMDIDSARLQSADLSKAVNLEQPQIAKTYGDSETQLPQGMERPAHWLENR